MTGGRAIVGVAAALICAVFAAPGAWAQEPGKVYRLVVSTGGIPLDQLSETSTSPRISAMMKEIRRLGWVESNNIKIERWRFADWPREEWDEFARQIVATGPDVIFSSCGTCSVALNAATDSIPIVFQAFRPIRFGLGESLARPGGNATGFAFSPPRAELGKRVQFLHEAVPNATQFAYLTVEHSAISFGLEEIFDEIAEALEITLVPGFVDPPVNESSIRAAFDTLKNLGTEALVVTSTLEFRPLWGLIAQLAKLNRLPTVGNLARAEHGILLGYASDPIALGLGSASYIDRILRGDNPAEMPIQQPTVFVTIINLKTAEALGITLPPALMIQATEFIE